MSKAEIASWITSTSTDFGDDDEIDNNATESKAQLSDEEKWSEFLSLAKSSLLTSQTKRRTEFLNDKMMALAVRGDLSLSQIMDLLGIIALTYPRYVDSPSRDGVINVLKALVKRDELRGTPEGEADANKLGVGENIFQWLGREIQRIGASRSSVALSNQVILFTWCCALLETELKYNPGVTTSPLWKPLLTAMATSLDLALEEHENNKKSLQKAAVVVGRRVIRNNSSKIPVILETVLDLTKSSSNPTLFSPMIGLIVDVALHLKPSGKTEKPGVDIVNPFKGPILQHLVTDILSSKTVVPRHRAQAFESFVTEFVDEPDVIESIVPAIEKGTLRAPEGVLPSSRTVFKAYRSTISQDSLRKLLTPILNSTKSSNPLVRTEAGHFFEALTSKVSDSSVQELAASEILSLPKAGKTTGAEHRIALYGLLSHISPSANTSPYIVNTSIPLISKESNDAAIASLQAVVAVHITHMIRSGISLSQESISAIAKEMSSTKAATRRAFFEVVGIVLYSVAEPETDEGSVLPALEGIGKAISQVLENSLKNISANPTAANAVPGEGYIAVFALLRWQKIPTFKAAVSKNAVLQSLATSSVKPSFLIWDKVYHKLSTENDERWLLYALEAAMLHYRGELEKNESVRLQFGTALIHLSVESSHIGTRKQSHLALQRLTLRIPELLHRTVRETFAVHISKESAPDDAQLWRTRVARRFSILTSIVSFSDQTDPMLKEGLLSELLIIAHHPEISPYPRQGWIELSQKAGLDPRQLVTSTENRLFEIILSSLTETGSIATAGATSATTIAFIAPDLTVDRLVQQVQKDLDVAQLNKIGPTEIAIWKTDEGTLYEDVLSSKKNSSTNIQKGKNQDIEKWEADLRKSLAAKKSSSSAAMSKQDKALVDAQLEKEAKIRKEVANVQSRLIRGLQLINSLIAAEVHEFQPYVATVATLLVDGILRKASFLVGELAFDTYLNLGKSCSPRLGSFNRWIGVATLRCFEIPVVPQELQEEDLSSLILRVLYRLRTLAEQLPFDPPTYSYTSPLLTFVIRSTGVGTTEPDIVDEQIALALNVVGDHSGECSNSAYPRLDMAKSLIYAIGHHQKFNKDASSSLAAWGQAASTSSTPQDARAIVEATLSQEVYVRSACLQALQPFDLTDLEWSPELWLACHDDDEQNARLANQLWDDNGLDLPEDPVSDLLPFLDHDHRYVRASCSTAISAAVQAVPTLLTQTCARLRDLYKDRARILAPEYDEFGMIREETLGRSDPWQTRQAIGITFEQLAPAFTPDEIMPFIKFLLVEEALGDGSAEVRRAMLQAGGAVVDMRGSTRLQDLIAAFEAYLKKNTGSSEASDYVKEAVIILFGRVARHLEATDSRVKSVVDLLIDALKTPSEVVQIAVSDCLPPLAQKIIDKGHLVDQLLTQTFTAPKYAERRGAAYGLSGIVKGSGLSALKEYQIVGRLRSAIEDKKKFESRQGALFVIETMTATLGRLFEPYVIELLSLLLGSFGDATPDVRDATQDTAKVVMANLSGYGVKQILPTLLEGLEEKQWRSKKGSIELLGSMAFCAPKQLSVSLPTVIPRLTDVLTDSHTQVRTAANKSLKQFGEVINNPEIQSLVPVLLKALVDPEKTPNGLNALLKTTFVHFIDSPSLALVVPILERGLKERGSDTKRKAAQIVGNLASLTEAKDFVPYLGRLTPLVHTVLIDPVPEARATAAKALGTLIERLGETTFPDLVPGLLQTLRSDTSGVDRQGAAQGLSEVLSGLGMERMEGLLPEIIENCRSSRSYVREGFMTLLVYLPATFGARFTPHLSRIIQPILDGIADLEELVRAASMKAGRMIINHYSNKAIDLLLPELERGMFDDSWRIRHSSITLIGELLYKISGISGKAEIDDDEEEADAAVAETSRRALVDVLGKDRRDRVLASLYLVRQDAVASVRQASIHIWKALVHNTPRTVRDILPSLVEQIVDLLATAGPDQQDTAAKTMGELCRKLGEKILSDIIPILKKGSTSTNPQVREGVCLAVGEVIENATESSREEHEDDLISMVRVSLVDESAKVRAAAAMAFDALQEHVGNRAIDQTIPTLLGALREPGSGSGTALQALKEIMTVRASTVFPVLIPTLIAPPITVFNANALCQLVTVAGDALSKRLTQILNPLVRCIESDTDDDIKEAVNETIRALLGSISDAEGLNTLMLLLLGWAKNEGPVRRVSAVTFFGIFCQETKLDFSLYRVDWIRTLVSLLDDSQMEVVEATWIALDSFVKAIGKDDVEVLVIPLRKTIESMGAPGRYVPGFAVQKGISPVLPIILAGLTGGSNDQREQAAYAIGDLVERTEEAALKPYTTQLTGPLIRVITQATNFPPAVKTAILTALMTMLDVVPTFVKPFFPQLQRTFCKSASDPASLAVRTRAAMALGSLFKSQTRVDPLVTELVGGIRGSDDSIAASLAYALSLVVKNAFANVGEASRQLIVEVLEESFQGSHDDSFYSSIAQLFAALALNSNAVRSLVENHLVAGKPVHALASHMLAESTANAPQIFYDLKCVLPMVRQVVACISSDVPSISRPAREARDTLKSQPPWIDDDAVQAVF